MGDEDDSVIGWPLLAPDDDVEGFPPLSVLDWPDFFDAYHNISQGNDSLANNHEGPMNMDTHESSQLVQQLYISPRNDDCSIEASSPSPDAILRSQYDLGHDMESCPV
jgi:hypothetical protein